MRVTVLGSGSSGNSILVESPDYRLLVDAGFSGRDLERRLATVGVHPEGIDGLLITHDHGDHTRGMGVLARRWGIPLFLTEPTRRACARLLDGSERVHLYTSARPLLLGGLRIDPFLTIHDAVDPVAVTVTELDSGEKLGIATDLGRPSATVRHALQGCDLLVLEANHDEILLRESVYPWSVKQRIAGSRGHLSNREAADLATELFHHGLAGVVLAHLSEQSNDPGLAFDVVQAALGRRGFRGCLEMGEQGAPIQPIDITHLRIRNRPAQLSLF